MKLAANIIKYFSAADRKADSNTIMKRFNEALAKELDAISIQKIEDILAGSLLPNYLSTSEYIEVYEQMFGFPKFSTVNTEQTPILLSPLEIIQTKGTAKSYEVLFRLLGFGGALVQAVGTNYQYKIILYNKVALDKTKLNVILKAAIYLEPIYASLYSIVSDKEYTLLTVKIEPNGDLTYETVLDIVLILDSKGDMLIENKTLLVFELLNGNLYLT